MRFSPPRRSGSRPDPRAHAHFRRRRVLAGLMVLAIAALLLRRATNGTTPPGPSLAAAGGRSTAPGATPGPSPSPAATSLAAPTRPAAAARPTPVAGSRAVLVTIPVLSQLPELPNGCEVTSLAMLLAGAGLPTDKLVLAREQKTNPTQPVFQPGARGDVTRIRSWGDPNQGFVGNVYGKYGYGIYHGPLFQLLATRTGARARDLTGQDFDSLIDRVDNGQAVLIWATTTLRPTTSWVTWQGPAGPFRGTFNEHAIVLVGHVGGELIINNPLTGRRQTVPADPLIAAWRQLGGQALTIDPVT
jgi:uncharacterized protein YvpB